MNLNDKTFISVMVPIRNEQQFIYNTLEQLANQDYPKSLYELIVVDGMSIDNTHNEVERFRKDFPDVQLQFHENPKFRSSAARNIAVQKAQGDYVLLIDGHVHIPDASLLSNMANAIVEHDPDVLGRPQPLDPPGISAFQKMVAICRNSKLAHSGESYIYSTYEGWVSPLSVAIMYRRSLFQKVGMFDEEFDASEDVEFNFRLEQVDYKCFISPKFTVQYYPRDSFKALFRQMTRYGLGRARFFQKHPDRFTVENAIPSVFLAAGVLGGIVSLLLPFFALLYLAGTCVYAALVIGELLFLQKVKHLPTLICAPAIVLTIHCGLGWGYLREKFRQVFAR